MDKKNNTGCEYHARTEVRTPRLRISVLGWLATTFLEENMDNEEAFSGGLILGLIFGAVFSAFVTVGYHDWLITSKELIIIDNSSYECKMVNTLKKD